MIWAYVTIGDEQLGCCPTCFALVQACDASGHEDWHGIDASSVNWREVREQRERWQ